MRSRIEFRHVVVAMMLVIAPTLALAGKGTVLRVVVVQTADADAYAKEIEKGKAILKSIGSPSEVRVWKARFAGDATGSVVVSVEWPSMMEMAKDDTRIAGSSEYMAWLKGLDKIRTVVSDSLYSELGP